MKKPGYKISAAAAFVMLAGIVMIYGIRSDAVEKHGLYISEVCPHNVTVAYDSIGFHNDYIELTNGGNKAINLSGYGLSDDDSDLRKYVFPDITVNPGESLIVWAGIQSVYTVPAGEEFEDESALYTGFGIRDHESLYLTSPDGIVADSVRIPELKEDRALLRNSSNEKGIKGFPKITGDPKPVISDNNIPPFFSKSSGYYDSPFELGIDGGGKEVLYTTDGTDPCVYGISYDKPIEVYDRSGDKDVYSVMGSFSNVNENKVLSPVRKAFIVRAVTKGEDGSYSNETSASFFVGKDICDIGKKTYTMSIISDPEGLFSDKNGIYVTGKIWEMNRKKAEEEEVDPRYAPTNYNMRGRSWRRCARVTFFDTNLKCLYDEDVTINIRGGSSRSMIQKSLAIKPKVAGEKVFDGLWEGAGDSFDLRTGGEDDTFLTNFRDALNSRIVEKMNICAQKSLCCQVYLDGEYWGCYSLRDHMDPEWISALYDVPVDNINLRKNNEVVSELQTDLEQYNEFEEFVKNNDLGIKENYDRFCEMADIDSLIDYYIAEIHFANYDAYINNTALWRSRHRGTGPYEDCKWRYILFDTDESDSIYDDWADKDSFSEGNWMGYNPDVELFFSNLSKNDEFRKRFRSRYKKLLSEDLSYETTGQFIDMFEDDYADAMVLSMQRYGGSDFSKEQYHKNVQIVRDFFEKRGEHISRYLDQHMGD